MYWYMVKAEGSNGTPLWIPETTERQADQMCELVRDSPDFLSWGTQLFSSGEMAIPDLPLQVIRKMREIFKSYTTCYVYYEAGEFNASPMKEEGGPYTFFCGRFVFRKEIDNCITKKMRECWNKQMDVGSAEQVVHEMLVADTFLTYYTLGEKNVSDAIDIWFLFHDYKFGEGTAE